MAKSAADTLIKFRKFARHNDSDKKINDDLTWDDWREYDQEQLTEALKQLHDEIIELIGADEVYKSDSSRTDIRDIAYRIALKHRNQLKAELRAKVDEYFGRQE